jgi:hypothetical protein
MKINYIGLKKIEKSQNEQQFLIELFFIVFRIVSYSSTIMFFQTNAVRPARSTVAARR